MHVTSYLLKLQIDHGAWLNAKVLSANQIAGFLNINISKTIGVITLIFCMQLHIC